MTCSIEFLFSGISINSAPEATPASNAKFPDSLQKTKIKNIYQSQSYVIYLKYILKNIMI